MLPRRFIDTIKRPLFSANLYRVSSLLECRLSSAAIVLEAGRSIERPRDGHLLAPGDSSLGWPLERPVARRSILCKFPPPLNHCDSSRSKPLLSLVLIGLFSRLGGVAHPDLGEDFPTGRRRKCLAGSCAAASAKLIDCFDADRVAGAESFVA